MQKPERIRRKQHLTEEGYAAIIKAVSDTHGKTLSRHMVDAYIWGKKTGKHNTPIKDNYGILPVFKAITDAEIIRKQEAMKLTAKKLKS